MDIQELLDRQAKLNNEERIVKNAIRMMRGKTPPPCFGEDDCSTLMLSTCPWRFDCGE